MYPGGWPECLRTAASQICREVVSPAWRWNIPEHQQQLRSQQTPWAADEKQVIDLYYTESFKTDQQASHVSVLPADLQQLSKCEKEKVTHN